MITVQNLSRTIGDCKADDIRLTWPQAKSLGAWRFSKIEV